MKNKLFLFALIFSLILLYSAFAPVQSFSISDSQDKTGEILLGIFENSGAVPYELKMEGWKKIRSKQASKKEMEEMVDTVLNEFQGEVIEQNWLEDKNFQSLHVTAQVQEKAGKTAAASSTTSETAATLTTTDPATSTALTTSATSNSTSTALANSDASAFLTVVAQNVKEDFYLITNIEGTNLNSINKWRKTITKIFNYYNSEPEITINMTGKFPTKLSHDEQAQLIKKLFKGADATIVEGISTENVVSQCGYSPYIKDQLVSGDKKINLNIAIRPHSEEDETYIFIGSPVLTMEY